MTERATAIRPTVSPHPSQYDPDLWVDEYYFLNQPGQGDIQLDLFYDYQNNVKSYPKWQQWLRDSCDFRMRWLDRAEKG